MARRKLRAVDLHYVGEILAAARKRPAMTPGEFALFTALDVRGGYAAEADEAARQYFAERGENLGAKRDIE